MSLRVNYYTLSFLFISTVIHNPRHLFTLYAAADPKVTFGDYREEKGTSHADEDKCRLLKTLDS